jgi:hypothetical protein
MRLAWTFVAGLYFAGFVLLATSPLLMAGLAAGYWARHAELFNALAGESVFGLRSLDGRMQGRMVNVNFHTAQILMPGDPRPRRVLLRLDIINTDVFSSGRAEGMVRLDAWPLDAPEDLRKPPLYTIVAGGRAATIEEDGTLVVERSGRRSVYSLADGGWMYDTDTAVAAFTLDGERRRVVALSGMEDDMPASTVAVLTYASAQGVLKRVLITAQDPTRARLLRSSVPLIRPVARMEDAAKRTIDLPLAAGMVRIPVAGDSLDLATAQVPVGLALVPLTPWRAKR